MDYYKITINITPFEDWLRDVLVAQLGEIGFDSFVETNGGVEAFIPAKNFHDNDFQFVLNEFHDDFSFSFEKEIIQSKNWNEEWEKNYFEPLLIAGQCVVRAPFHKNYPKTTYEVVIEPNMAFGTGNHETTTMMLETILKTDLTEKTVLDMGCGTGILGILASMKGATKVTAIDIDEWSYNGTVENSRLNHISNLEVKIGDAGLLGSEYYDVILANIHKNVLIADMPSYCSVLKPGGLLIMSGFYTEDLADIETEARRLKLNPAGFLSKNNWVACSFMK